VKATRVKTPRIVHHGERRYWGWWLLAMALLLAALWQVYEFGKRQGGYLAARELAERVRIAAQMSAQEKRLASLQAEAARYRRQAEIEAQASRKVQEEMVRQQETIADLKAEVKMLKGLISSGAGSLYARDFVIEPASEPRHYRYRFTLVQVKEDVPLTRGKLLMKVIGRVGKKSRTLDRSEFSPDKQKTVKLEFSNYQDVQGEILLPEKFEPREVRIEFLPRNKELKKLDIRFPWPQAQAAKES
jgi:multidrug efflux pump subunit AcrA (membrane-fusion protein)